MKIRKTICPDDLKKQSKKEPGNYEFSNWKND